MIPTSATASTLALEQGLGARALATADLEHSGTGYISEPA